VGNLRAKIGAQKAPFGAQTAQQAMQGQGSDNSGSQPPQQDDQPGSGRDYVGMFGAGGGDEEDQAAPAPRPSMFARAGGQ